MRLVNLTAKGTANPFHGRDSPSTPEPYETDSGWGLVAVGKRAVQSDRHTRTFSNATHVAENTYLVSNCGVLLFARAKARQANLLTSEQFFSGCYALETTLSNTCSQTSRERDRKSTRLNSSHVAISYAVFCLKKK